MPQKTNLCWPYFYESYKREDCEYQVNNIEYVILKPAKNSSKTKIKHEKCIEHNTY